MEGRPKIKWLQFRLRTLLLLIALVSIGLSIGLWIDQRLDWIDERKWRHCESMDSSHSVASRVGLAPLWVVLGEPSSSANPAPLELRLFAEGGFTDLLYLGPPEYLDKAKQI